MLDGSETLVTTDIGSPTLQVIAIGFGRTGTKSLRAALARLGFTPCVKMSDWTTHPERLELWLEAVRCKRAGEPIDWRPIFAGCHATIDWPGVYFWRELVAAHPMAKVILTIRDPERWYDSALTTVYANYRRRTASPVGRHLRRLLAWLAPAARNRYRIQDETMWNGTFQGRFHDRAHTIRLFEEHIREVQAAVPEERLLVFDVREGWVPLCQFLGVPVPKDEPFPHVNRGADWRRPPQYYLTLARVPLRAIGAAVAGGVGGRLTGIGYRDRPHAKDSGGMPPGRGTAGQ